MTPFALSYRLTKGDKPDSSPMKIVVIDNFDSFTWNFVQLLYRASSTHIEVEVIRNNAIGIEELCAKGADGLVLSPGPGNPSNTGISKMAIDALEVPIIGICLGHQTIFEHFGGKIIRAPFPVHGHSDLVNHDNKTIFSGVRNPLSVARYHSLSCDRSTTPDCIEEIAWTADGILMGLRHRSKPIFGLQFHPESFLTVEGVKLVQNFIATLR